MCASIRSGSGACFELDDAARAHRPRGLGRRRALVSRAAAERDHAQRHYLASYDRSVFLGLVYTAALALVAAASFLRRDVTT